MIVRIQKRPRWTSIAQTVLNDARLSYGALGLLVYLLSRPDDWTVIIRQLANSRGVSDYAVKELLKELRGYGYARLDRPRDRDGRVMGTEYVIVEDPEAEAAPEPAPAPKADERTPAPALDRPPVHGDLTPAEEDYAAAFGRDVLDGLPLYPRDLLRSMTDEPARRAVLHLWAGNGYKPTSVASMRDRYQATLAARAEGDGRRSHGRDDVTARSVADDSATALALLDSLTE